MRETRSSSGFDVRRELDEVVGPYQPNRGTWMVRAGRWIARALIVACFAVAVVAAISFGLHSQLRDAETAPAPKRPVTVEILPAGK